MEENTDKNQPQDTSKNQNNAERQNNAENKEKIAKTENMPGLNPLQTQKSHPAEEGEDISFERTIPIRTDVSWDKLEIPLERNTNICAKTILFENERSGSDVKELLGKYKALTKSRHLATQTDLSLDQQVGSGTQGVVYFSERHSTDDFYLPVALKFFSPDGFESDEEYKFVMNYHARIASKIAQIQHDNLVGVRNWFMLNDIRIMEMEWVDGYDLSRLADNRTIRWMKRNFSQDVYRTATDVILTSGPARARFKPGVALSIIRECLSALEALHRGGIVHCDIKPANIMLKKSGHVKIIDFGAAFFFNETPPTRLCTPFYAAPELLKGNMFGPPTPQADIASLGYVLIELMAGRSPFENIEKDGHQSLTVRELLRQKNELPDKLDRILPVDVLQNQQLVNLCRRMVHPDLNVRFRTAESAITSGGVAEILRSLILYGLASEYDVDLGSWISRLKLPQLRDGDSPFE